jgi:hypothetical protein
VLDASKSVVVVSTIIPLFLAGICVQACHCIALGLAI